MSMALLHLCWTAWDPEYRMKKIGNRFPIDMVIWTNAEILLIWTLGITFKDILSFFQENTFENVVWEVSAIFWFQR